MVNAQKVEIPIIIQLNGIYKHLITVILTIISKAQILFFKPSALYKERDGSGAAG